MKSVFSYMIVMMAAMYWGFRVVVSLLYSMGVEFFCQPVNEGLEIFILFLTIPSIIFVIRRNIIAATLYLGMYASYFGTIVYNSLIVGATEGNVFALTDNASIVASIVGIIIPVLVFLDIVIQKSGFQPTEKNTDWYYENEKYDRKFDERADRNQYKIK